MGCRVCFGSYSLKCAGGAVLVFCRCVRSSIGQEFVFHIVSNEIFLERPKLLTEISVRLYCYQAGVEYHLYDYHSMACSP